MSLISYVCVNRGIRFFLGDCGESSDASDFSLNMKNLDEFGTLTVN